MFSFFFVFSDTRWSFFLLLFNNQISRAGNYYPFILELIVTDLFTQRVKKRKKKNQSKPTNQCFYFEEKQTFFFFFLKRTGKKERKERKKP